jgi:hypothetical protein
MVEEHSYFVLLSATKSYFQVSIAKYMESKRKKNKKKNNYKQEKENDCQLVLPCTAYNCFVFTNAAMKHILHNEYLFLSIMVSGCSPFIMLTNSISNISSSRAKHNF